MDLEADLARICRLEEEESFRPFADVSSPNFHEMRRRELRGQRGGVYEEVECEIEYLEKF